MDRRSDGDSHRPGHRPGQDSSAVGDRDAASVDDQARRLGRELERLGVAGARVLEAWMERQSRGDFFTLPDARVVARSLIGLGECMARHPERVLETQARVASGCLELWRTTALRFLGDPAPSPVESNPRDRRFHGDGWTQNLVFDALRQAYLLTAEEYFEMAEEISGQMDPEDREKARFYYRQMLDALSPSNFATTNPDVLQETVRTGGENLLRGMVNLMDDLVRGEGLLRIRQSNTSAFELGRNIAATPGKVVYQNELMQLIQYSPSTESVDRRPLLIVPPWINKYYILDLSPKRSFIRWAVSQGLTVFLISWVNPDESYADVAFDDYLTRGTLTALECIAQATGEREVNALGYCIGGTLLACTLAWLAARGEQPVQSATFFTTLLDYTDVGPLSVFIDEEQIRHVERHMEKRGYLEGTHLANAFNLLQSNDLIWSFVVNNYLLGREPSAFDLLHWNSDSTRMPCRMHSSYLRNMYLENRLREPGAIRLAGEAIDLRAVRVSSFCLATRNDHIAPWQSCYASARLLGRSPRFVLGGSGHIAGVINPAGSTKYGYWSGSRLPADPERWLQGAEYQEGSWWPNWRKWLRRSSGGQVDAREPGGGKLQPVEDAPGSYVRVRS